MSSHEADIPVLVRAPFGRDAELIRAVLQPKGVTCVMLGGDGEEDLASLCQDNCILICTQEGLTRPFLEQVDAAVKQQATWAQIPLILVLDADIEGDDLMAALRPIWSGTLVSVVHRPVRIFQFESAVENMIAARLRQLETKQNISYQQELRNELNHRIKNTLATFMAIYHMAMRESRDLEDFKARFDERARALNVVQDIVRDTDSESRTLPEIARLIFAPYNSRRTRIHLHGRPYALDSQPAITVALMLNELVTNAAKYGALSNDAGNIDLRWAAGPDNPDELSIEWRETGGPEVKTPQRQSYGSRFIQNSAKGLGGQAILRYPSEGFACDITLSLDSLKAGPVG